MELIEKKGFKNTEVGLIPEDWQVLPIGESLIFKNGLNKASEFFGYGTPILNYMDVFKHHGIHKSDIKGKVFLTAQEKKNFSAKKGDVFFTRTSETQEEIGISAVLLDEIEDCVFSGFVLRGRPKNQIISPFYYQYCLEPDYVRNQIIGKSSYTTRALTNGRYLSQVNIIIPPTLTEQKAIATALSDVDELISSLEQLITKKKAIKQGAMQQLLTGKTRVKGFEGSRSYKQTEVGMIPEDWELLTIGECSTCFSGGTPKTDIKEFYNGNINWISSSELNQSRINRTARFISEKGLESSSAQMVSRGTFLLAMYGATAGVCAITNIEGAINQAVLAIHSTKIESEFLYNFFSLRKDWIIRTYTQGGQPNLSGHIVKSIKIPLPPTLTEQKAIAQILSDMDVEIEQLETKKAKCQSIKQGMMQELLTGKTRLV